MISFDGHPHLVRRKRNWQFSSSFNKKGDAFRRRKAVKTPAQNREALRAILAGPRCVYPASVFDPISGRIASDLGFEMAMFAGSVASMTVLGAPDLIVLTLSEFAEQSRRITRACPLPLLVDADHGYGNALNVMRTVQELEQAGVAAMSIEDTRLPRDFGPISKVSMISVEEGVGKMRAAVEARTDPGLVIAGRTSAMAISGVEETLARVKAYEACGVDAIFLAGLSSREQLDAIAPEIRLPIILGGAKPVLHDLDYLSARGVRICLQGHQTFAAAVKAVHDVMKALRDGASPKTLVTPETEALLRRLTEEDAYTVAQRKYMS
jgi:carboxyvinyl-carboxyphosphonate phosphorylmutase